MSDDEEIEYKKVGKYEVDIDNEIGSGSEGFVFLGREIASHTPIAAKKISLGEDEHSIQDAMKEAEALKKITLHPNIISFLGMERKKKHLWIFSEFCRLGDLNKYCIHNEVDLLQKVKFMCECTKAIDHLHGLSPPIVHRDVKPQNVLIVEDSERVIAKVCYFGLARISMSPTGSTINMRTLCGTEGYMAPEIFALLKGRSVEYNNSVDVFSLGVLYISLLEAKKGHALKPMESMLLLQYV